MALLYACKRTATVSAMVESEVLALSREAYQLTLMNEDQVDDAAVAAADISRLKDLQSIAWVYELIPSAARKEVAKILLEVNVQPKVELLQPGRVAGVLLVILSGEIAFTGDAQKKTRDGGVWRESGLGELCADTVLRGGDVIALGRPGDEAMLAAFHATSPNAEGKLRCLGGTHHHTGLVTRSKVHYLALPLAELVHLIGPHGSIIASPDGRRALLQNLPWAQGLSKKEVDALALACRPGMYTTGDVIMQQGEKSKFIYLLVAGEVTLSKKVHGRDAVVCRACAGDVLGERELLTSTPSNSTATVTAEHTFCLLVDAHEVHTLAPSYKARAEARTGWPLSQQDHPFESLSQFQVKARVGVGAFAQVALVRHAGTASVYALKRMNRAHLESEKVMGQLMHERFILGDFHHPCIAKLAATFKTRISLYMLLEPCMGGELFSRMRTLRRLDEDAARFYSACVVSAFEYLQSRHVLYRDLKPENVMIHADGYIRVVDFGFAKRVFTRTYTVCGTPEYLAPELLMMKGHGFGVDWWALGVLLYEMVVGVAPFCFHPETKKPDADLPPPDLYKNILNPKYELPFPSRLSPAICELIEQLLAWDPLTRLGCLTDGAAGVRRAAYYKEINFEKLYRHELPPPYMPPLKSDDDVANFEESDAVPNFLNEPAYDYKDAWDADF